jgi:hypothetical protein
MRADFDCELAPLEKDLQSREVKVRYHLGSERREVELDHTFCPGPSVEIVVRAFIEVTPCNCSQCDSGEEEEPTKTIIPLGDVVDVEVREFEDHGYQGEPYNHNIPEFLPFARWLRNRFGLLKRFALDT